MSSISYKTLLSGLALGLVFAFPALAGDIEVSSAHAEMMKGMTDRGDIFVTFTNNGKVADRLYAVRTPVAKSAELESESEEKVVAGSRAEATAFLVKAGQTLELTEEGPHIELLGLKRPLVPGETIAVTLFFEKAGRVKIEVPVMEEHD